MSITSCKTLAAPCILSEPSTRMANVASAWVNWIPAIHELRHGLLEARDAAERDECSQPATDSDEPNAAIDSDAAQTCTNAILDRDRSSLQDGMYCSRERVPDLSHADRCIMP
eukprot:3441620-Rhodomonas_salina.1